jgi:hypothetical protein
VHTWDGDLVVRVMPGGRAGSPAASFTLYDGTRLQWDGRALQVDGNPKPRTIELRAPDGSVVVRQIEAGSSLIS